MHVTVVFWADSETKTLSDFSICADKHTFVSVILQMQFPEDNRPINKCLNTRELSSFTGTFSCNCRGVKNSLKL